MKRPSASDATRHLDSLRAELDQGLAADPEALLHPAFLGVLHRELRERLGPADAEAVLMRAGFFHGLRDALRTLRSQAAQPGCAAPPPAPLLAMALAPAPPGLEALAARGCWPEASEARALEALETPPREPACLLSCGYTSGWLSGLWDAEVLALEESCVACGSVSCRFVAREAEVWRAAPDRRAARMLDMLPFDALWKLAQASLPEPDESGAAIDRDSPAVHVWGPVMVVPYAGLETVAAVEAVARDPAGREVCVVVVDLAGAILDEGFGAVALDRTLEAIEAWGAEALLTGVSPLAESVLADLDRARLVLRKDLPDAVAAAFQIADARRHPA